MKSLIISGSSRELSVNFNSKTGDLKITGRSHLENPMGFFRELFEWLDRYKDKVKNKDKINLTIEVEYINTSSLKCLLDVFKKLEEIHKEKQNVTIHWVYETDDEDMLETGQDYESIIKIPFNMIEVEKGIS